MGYKSSGLVFAEKPSIGIEPTRLYDASRFGNHGTHTNITMVQLPSGLWVRQFNGTTSYITIPDDPSLHITDNISLVVWLYFITLPSDTGDSVSTIISKKHASTSFQMRISDSDTVRCDLYGLDDPFPSGSPAALDGQRWHHCAITYDGSYIRTFLDGNNQLADTATGSITSNTDVLEIGREPAGVRYTDGYIVLPKIYNYALSAGQIKKAFEESRHWFGV